MTLGRGEGGEAPATLLAKQRHRQQSMGRVQLQYRYRVQGAGARF